MHFAGAISDLPHLALFAQLVPLSNLLGKTPSSNWTFCFTGCVQSGNEQIPIFVVEKDVAVVPAICDNPAMNKKSTPDKMMQPKEENTYGVIDPKTVGSSRRMDSGSESAGEDGMLKPAVGPTTI